MGRECPCVGQRWWPVSPACLLAPYSATSPGPYVLPNANLGFTFFTFFGEIFFMLWLLIRGWKIRPQPPRVGDVVYVARDHIRE